MNTATISLVWDNPKDYWHATVKVGAFVLCQCDSMHSEADAREKAGKVVKACNSHAALVAALEKHAENFDDAIHGRKPRHHQMRLADETRAALAAARA